MHHVEPADDDAGEIKIQTTKGNSSEASVCWRNSRFACRETFPGIINTTNKFSVKSESWQKVMAAAAGTLLAAKKFELTAHEIMITHFYVRRKKSESMHAERREGAS